MRHKDADAFASLIQQTRLRLMAINKGDYNQAAIAQRVGVSQALYSKWETGNFERLPESDVLTRIAKELGLTSIELLASAGYDLEPETPEQMVARMSLTEYLRRKYNIEEVDNLVAVIEGAIRDIKSKRSGDV